jgi:hypothetical protein
LVETSYLPVAPHPSSLRLLKRGKSALVWTTEQGKDHPCVRRSFTRLSVWLHLNSLIASAPFHIGFLESWSPCGTAPFSPAL